MASISSTVEKSSSIFSSAPRIPADAIFALTAEYLADTHPQKVNLGQGAYRDDKGQPYVLPSVRESRRIINEQGLQHEYLPILGLKRFREKAAELVLGSDAPAGIHKRLATCQTLSGTGSLHLAAKIIRYCQQPTLPKIYIPNPTWSNHHLIFESLGFECKSFQYYDHAIKRLDIDFYLSTLRAAEPGSIVILHACAHNPTGLDPSPKQWKDIGTIIKDRNLFPLFDSAYLGFSSGDFDKDAFPIRLFVNELRLEVAVCLSFAKNMGLYGERVGCFLLATTTQEVALNCQSVLEQLQRSEISNPPAFGARIAETILADDMLRQAWFEDMKRMSSRIQSMRKLLYDHLIARSTSVTWDHLLRQSGMFGFLGLPPEVVKTLKDEYHIYMAANSRISIAGLNSGNVEYVARSIAEVLSRGHNVFVNQFA